MISKNAKQPPHLQIMLTGLNLSFSLIPAWPSSPAFLSLSSPPSSPSFSPFLASLPFFAGFLLLAGSSASSSSSSATSLPFSLFLVLVLVSVLVFFLSLLGSCLLAGLVLFLMLVFGTCLFAGHHLLYTTPLSPYFHPTSSWFVIFP